MKKYLLLTLLVIASFLFLTVASAMVLNDEQQTLESEKRALDLRPAHDPERGEIEEVIVPPERIPEGYEERMRAAAITLLPNHLRAPEARSDVDLPSREQKKIEKRVSGFLRAWESYSPGEENWQKGWQRFVLPESRRDIALRRDSSDAPGVCPEKTCSVGSSWFGNRAAVFPVDYDEDHLYLVAYGALRYRGNTQINPYAGGSTERSYGIVLLPSDSGWMVARVAAESLR